MENGASEKLLLGYETYRMLGACFEVYKKMGCGFLEAVYIDCLKIEFASREIPFEHQPRMHLTYKGTRIEHVYIPDFICFGSVILEVKAVSELAGPHRAQVINYLRCSDIEVGLLVNFGHHPLVEHERFAARELTPEVIQRTCIYPSIE